MKTRLVFALSSILTIGVLSALGSFIVTKITNINYYSWGWTFTTISLITSPIIIVNLLYYKFYISTIKDKLVVIIVTNIMFIIVYLFFLLFLAAGIYWNFHTVIILGVLFSIGIFFPIINKEIFDLLIDKK